MILSYIIRRDNEVESQTKVVKIDTQGNLVGEQTLPNCQASSYYHNLLPSHDSLGCRVIVGRKDGPMWLVYDCYTLDSNLDIIDVKENIEQLSYPYVPDNTSTWRPARKGGAS